MYRRKDSNTATHTHTLTHKQTNKHTHTHTHTLTHKQTNKQTHTQRYARTHTETNEHSYKQKHTYMYAHTRARARTRTHRSGATCVIGREVVNTVLYMPISRLSNPNERLRNKIRSNSPLRYKYVYVPIKVDATREEKCQSFIITRGGYFKMHLLLYVSSNREHFAMANLTLTLFYPHYLQ